MHGVGARGDIARWERLASAAVLLYLVARLVYLATSLDPALPPDELTPFVEELAYRIASFPASAIALAKASVGASELPTHDGLIEEAHYFNQSLATADAQERMATFLQVGGQTAGAELDLMEILQKLNREHR